MADTTNKSNRPDPATDLRIPQAPPMQDRTLRWWPLLAALAAFAAWLVFLAILAINSDRWRPG